MRFRIPLVVEFVVWIFAAIGLICVASWFLPAHAQTVDGASAPPPGLVHDLLWLLAVAAFTWLAAEMLRGLAPKVLAPKPSTFLSRLVTRVVALGVGLLLGRHQLTPTFGLDVPAVCIASGAVGGFGAVILHPFFNWAKKAAPGLLKALAQRFLAKAGSAPPPEAETAKEPTDG